MSDRRWCAVAATVVLCCTALVLVMLHAPASVTVPTDDYAEFVAPVLAAAACVLAGRRHRGRTRAGWYLVGASAAAWGAGQGTWTWLELFLHQDNPFPSLADAGFMASVPLLFMGLFTMPVWPAGAVASTAPSVTAFSSRVGCC